MFILFSYGVEEYYNIGSAEIVRNRQWGGGPNQSKVRDGLT